MAQFEYALKYGNNVLGLRVSNGYYLVDYPLNVFSPKAREKILALPTVDLIEHGDTLKTKAEIEGKLKVESEGSHLYDNPHLLQAVEIALMGYKGETYSKYRAVRSTPKKNKIVLMAVKEDATEYRTSVINQIRIYFRGLEPYNKFVELFGTSAISSVDKRVLVEGKRDYEVTVYLDGYGLRMLEETGLFRTYVAQAFWYVYHNHYDSVYYEVNLTAPYYRVPQLVTYVTGSTSDAKPLKEEIEHLKKSYYWVETD